MTAKTSAETIIPTMIITPIPEAVPNERFSISRHKTVDNSKTTDNNKAMTERFKWTFFNIKFVFISFPCTMIIAHFHADSICF